MFHSYFDCFLSQKLVAREMNSAYRVTRSYLNIVCGGLTTKYAGKCRTSSNNNGQCWTTLSNDEQCWGNLWGRATLVLSECCKTCYRVCKKFWLFKIHFWVCCMAQISNVDFAWYWSLFCPSYYNSEIVFYNIFPWDSRKVWFPK